MKCIVSRYPHLKRYFALLGRCALIMFSTECTFNNKEYVAIKAWIADTGVNKTLISNSVFHLRTML